MKINYKRLSNDVPKLERLSKDPIYGLYAQEDIIIGPNESIQVPTGIVITYIKKGWVVLIMETNSCQDIRVTGYGMSLGSKYDIKVEVTNMTTTNYLLTKGDLIAQLVVVLPLDNEKEVVDVS